MKYCMDFDKHSKYFGKTDEINILYNRIESDEALISFCDMYKKTRVNVCMEEGYKLEDLEHLFELQETEKDYQIYIRLPRRDSAELDFLLAKFPNPKFYFETRVNNWDLVVGLIGYGVSDIYVTEALGFEINKVAAVAHAAGIQVRVFPNVAQSSWDRIPDLKKFWIRPEDLGQYESYIDVCEFYGDIKKFDVYYDIYKKDKKWLGNLSEIIIGLKEPFDSRFIVPRFVKKRTRCGRECLKGGNCKMCEHIIELSGNLEKANLIVTMEEDKHKEEE